MSTRGSKQACGMVEHLNSALYEGHSLPSDPGFWEGVGIPIAALEGLKNGSVKRPQIWTDTREAKKFWKLFLDTLDGRGQWAFANKSHSKQKVGEAQAAVLGLGESAQCVKTIEGSDFKIPLDDSLKLNVRHGRLGRLYPAAWHILMPKSECAEGTQTQGQASSGKRVDKLLGALGQEWEAIEQLQAYYEKNPNVQWDSLMDHSTPSKSEKKELPSISELLATKRGRALLSSIEEHILLMRMISWVNKEATEGPSGLWLEVCPKKEDGSDSEKWVISAKGIRLSMHPAARLNPKAFDALWEQWQIEKKESPEEWGSWGEFASSQSALMWQVHPTQSQGCDYAQSIKVHLNLWDLTGKSPRWALWALLKALVDSSKRLAQWIDTNIEGPLGRLIKNQEKNRNFDQVEEKLWSGVRSQRVPLYEALWEQQLHQCLGFTRQNMGLVFENEKGSGLSEVWLDLLCKRLIAEGSKQTGDKGQMAHWQYSVAQRVAGAGLQIYAQELIEWEMVLSSQENYTQTRGKEAALNELFVMDQTVCSVIFPKSLGDQITRAMGLLVKSLPKVSANKAPTSSDSSVFHLEVSISRWLYNLCGRISENENGWEKASIEEKKCINFTQKYFESLIFLRGFEEEHMHHMCQALKSAKEQSELQKLLRDTVEDKQDVLADGQTRPRL